MQSVLDESSGADKIQDFLVISVTKTLDHNTLSHCKSYEDLIKGGKTDKEIIESATRGNPVMAACTGLYEDYYDTYSWKNKCGMLRMKVVINYM